MASSILFISSLIAIAAVEGIHAVKYDVTNKVPDSLGGRRFDDEIGAAFSLKKMDDATTFIWKTFMQSEADRKNVDSVSLFIDHSDYIAVEFDDKITVNNGYIENYTDPDLQSEFAGIIQHEMTHVWQWNGNGQTPEGLVEGIAEFVRLKAGYVSSHWPKPGEGDSWDQGYGITARFLDYCNSLRDGFVADLNAKMRTSYSDNFFLELLGKPVDQLWKEYKSQYGN